ncbi:hypothetical protein BDN72DRAFT_963330 [Pluteus cervinus]|uniref:Uncharacterized protein n=1 Tax=Pluteus cervinus TaxID=181527 RepID=A0ACD3AFW0_9AGAR|nr:hypothetical protein BDN72DRAFT_963330 [Pluteus cervinus]
MGEPSQGETTSDGSIILVESKPPVNGLQPTCTEISEQRLPCELEQVIFELVALANRSEIPTLMLVSQRTRIWLAKYLYSAIIRRGMTGDPARQTYNPPTAALPSYARHVNYLLVYFVIETDVLMSHLSQCLNLTNVAMWCQSLPEGTLAALSALPALVQLTVNISALMNGAESDPYDLSDPLFGRLTHLDVLDGCPSWSKLSGLQTLVNLTHLGLTDVSDVVLLGEIMKSCTKLSAVVLHESGLDEGDYQDVRIVQCQFKTADYVDDWIKQAEGRRCFWDVVEDLIRERRNKNSQNPPEVSKKAEVNDSQNCSM